VTSIALAFGSAFLFGLALVLTQLALRDVSSLAGAAISIPSSTLLFVCAAPFVLADATVQWRAVPIFAAVGLIFPGAVTLVTFAANRLLGPVMTGTLGNLAPLFAVALAITVLGEPLRAIQLVGLIVTVAGVVLLAAARGDDGRHRLSWYLLLPIVAALLRGVTQATIKLGLELWPSAFAAALIGYAVSTIVVLTAAKIGIGRFVVKARPRGLLWFAAVGWSNGIAALLMYAALATGPVTLVSPLVATYPLVTVALSAVMLHNVAVTARLALAVAVTVAGVGLLIAG
jgi:drug/metabolite transporter (DMT)-like permease